MLSVWVGDSFANKLFYWEETVFFGQSEFTDLTESRLVYYGHQLQTFIPSSQLISNSYDILNRFYKTLRPSYIDIAYLPFL